MGKFPKALMVSVLSILAAAACSSKDKKQEAAAAQPVQAVQAPPVAENTRQYLETSAMANNFEIRASEIAGERTKSVEVARYASRMVTDHTEALNQTRKVAEQLKVELPKDMTLEQQRKLDKLNELSSEELNRAYADFMVSAHRQQLDATNLYIQDATVPQARTLAENSLSMIAEHFQMAIDMRNDLQRDSLRRPASIPPDAHQSDLMGN